MEPVAAIIDVHPGGPARPEPGPALARSPPGRAWPGTILQRAVPGQPTGSADGPSTGRRACFLPGQPAEPGLLVGLGAPAAHDG